MQESYCLEGIEQLKVNGFKVKKFRVVEINDEKKSFILVGYFETASQTEDDDFENIDL